jgi:hypothetical protein
VLEALGKAGAASPPIPPEVAQWNEVAL